MVIRYNEIAQIRLGILPLKIETGRFNNTKAIDRICEICNLNLVEDEMHFICLCPLYQEDRKTLFDAARSLYPTFNSLSTVCQFKFIMQNLQYDLEKYLVTSWQKRQQKLYT